MDKNALGQPLGPLVPGWAGAQHPTGKHLRGQHVVLAPLRMEDAQELFNAFAEDKSGAGSTYLFTGPFESAEQLAPILQSYLDGPDLFYTIRDAQSAKVLGQASYLRIAPSGGSIEVGNIHFAPPLQRTPGATEAMALMMAHAFDELGYRRYEWKCNALNAPSRKAAERLGFTFEGIHRQALVVKGRNRDTAWFSILDHEWPDIKSSLTAWLDAGNFDARGQQIRSLSEIRCAANPSD